MRGRKTVWAAALVAALAAGGASAEEPAGPKQESSWWRDLFRSAPPKPEVKAPPAPTAAERGAQTDKLMNAFLRRQAACDRLARIGHETDNQGLIDEARRLEELAWRVFSERSQKVLSVAEAGPAETARPAGLPSAPAERPAALPPPRPLVGGPLMKRYLPVALLFLAPLGCTAFEKGDKGKLPVVPPPTAIAVSADGITEKNAAAKVGELRAELDNELAKDNAKPAAK